MKKNKVSKKQLKENIDFILDIVRNNSNMYYERSQNVDNKSGFFIAFHGAVLFLLVNPQKINDLFKMQCSNVGQILKYSTLIILQISILILAIISICLFIWSLKSRNIKYISTSICEEKYYKSKSIYFKKELLKGYKDISEYNEGIIDQKHTLYNYASIITLNEVILVGINLIIQMT